MSQGYFITGTDTGVGKTTFSIQLINHLISQGKTVSVLKPVAAGCEKINGLWKNSDAVKLLNASTTEDPYQQVNPVAFPQAIAPHIAAKKNKINLKAETIYQQCRSVLRKPRDYCVVEGAGGWLVPLNQTQTFADLALLYNFPVILVVSIKLGCINHALLTTQAIQQSPLPVAGWVANIMDEKMEYISENIETLKQAMDFPLLATLKWVNNNIQCHWSCQSI